MERERLNVPIAMERADGIVKIAMVQENALIAMVKVVSHAKHVRGREHVENVEGEEKFGARIAMAKAFALIAKARRKSHVQDV